MLLGRATLGLAKVPNQCLVYSRCLVSANWGRPFRSTQEGSVHPCVQQPLEWGRTLSFQSCSLNLHHSSQKRSVKDVYPHSSLVIYWWHFHTHASAVTFLSSQGNPSPFHLTMGQFHWSLCKKLNFIEGLRCSSVLSVEFMSLTPRNHLQSR